MTTILQSFVAGRWVGQQPAQALHSAINGKEVAFAHAESLDFAEALAYGRSKGLHGMLALDFQQRAAALRALAKYLLLLWARKTPLPAHTSWCRAAVWQFISMLLIFLCGDCWKNLHPPFWPVCLVLASPPQLPAT